MNGNWKRSYLHSTTCRSMAPRENRAKCWLQGTQCASYTYMAFWLEGVFVSSGKCCSQSPVFSCISGAPHGLDPGEPLQIQEVGNPDNLLAMPWWSPEYCSREEECLSSHIQQNLPDQVTESSCPISPSLSRRLPDSITEKVTLLHHINKDKN